MEHMPNKVKALSSVKDKYGSKVVEGKEYKVLDMGLNEKLIIDAEGGGEMVIEINDPDFLMIYEAPKQQASNKKPKKKRKEEVKKAPKQTKKVTEEPPLNVEEYLADQSEFKCDVVYEDIKYTFTKIDVDVSHSAGFPPDTVIMDYMIQGFKGFEADTLFMILDFSDDSYSFTKKDGNNYVSIEDDELFALANTLVQIVNEHLI